MLSESEFEGWHETVHLLGSPRNAECLLRGLRQFERGPGAERDLLPPAA